MFSKELAMPYHNLEWFEYMNTESRLQEGISLHQEGKLDQAELIYQQILQINPENAEVLHLLGMIAYQVEKYDLAVNLINQAIEIDNRQPIFFHNLGLVLKDRGDLEGAIRVYQQVVRANPKDSEAYNNLGNVLQENKRFEEGIVAYRKAIEINSNFADAHSNLGVALVKQERFEEGIVAYRKAIEADSNFADAYYNLGNALQKKGDVRDAIQAYHRVLKINPNYAEAYNNLGVLAQEEGQMEDALQYYQCAIKVNPNYAEAHRHYGMALLLTGDFLHGWKEHEWRWRRHNISYQKKSFPQPWWDGSILERKTILVWTEQGVGDEIMFASMLDDLLQMNANIMVECEPRLVPLLQRSFSQIQFFPRENPSNPKLLNTSIDYQIPVGSLGQWLRQDESCFRKSQPSYLLACSDKVSKLRKKYQALAKEKLLIGISWKSANQRVGKIKSTSLKNWTTILSQPNCYFINLQYGDVDAEIKQYTSGSNTSIYIDKEINSLMSLDDFTAQVSALDLIISTSNTTVHVAGALGKDVWTLAPYISDWKWMLAREDTPWYPTMRIFRQSKIGDWEGVFLRVNQALKTAQDTHGY